MPWIAIAATVDNIVIAADDDLVMLEECAEYDFDVIVRSYGVSAVEYAKLKAGNLAWRIKFHNVRSTYLEPVIKTDYHNELSEIYSLRFKQLINIKGRLEHALNKHKALMSQQLTIYEAKLDEAKDILSNPDSIFVKDGFVNDYAEEAEIDIRTAAQLVLIKHTSWYEHLRKIERLRLRHVKAIKKAKTPIEFAMATTAIDKDFFINMLL